MKFVKVKEDPSHATDFNFLTNMIYNFYMLQPLGEGRRGDYISFSCTCPEYSKRRACHHSQAKGMKDGLVQIPVDRSFQNVGKK